MNCYCSNFLASLLQLRVESLVLKLGSVLLDSDTTRKIALPEVEQVIDIHRRLNKRGSDGGVEPHGRSTHSGCSPSH